MQVRKQLVPEKHRLVNSGTNPITSITVHETGNTGKGADAAAHAKLQERGNSRNASWHETVDDTEAVISYPATARCRHAGTAAGNNTSYSLEICVNSDGDFEQAVRNAARRVRALLEEHDLPLSAVVQHHRWSKKNCPTRLRAGGHGIDWSEFIELVRDGVPDGPIGVVRPDPVAVPQQPIAVPRPTPSAPAAAELYAALVPDGDLGPITVRAFQTLMKRIGRYTGEVDGVWGPMTSTAAQSWLAGLGHYTGRVDGQWGPMSRKALQRFLASKGLDVGPDDGVQGPRTVRALQAYLNDQRRYV